MSRAGKARHNPRDDSPAALLRRYGLRPKKRLGQCFLHDPRIADAIVEASAISDDETVVEIGAGLGVLTRRLAHRARRVVAIELDRDLAAVLRAELGDNEKIEIIEQDALRFDFGRLGEPVLVVGNLPYNISSQLIFHLLDSAPAVRSATVMLQRELADRLVSPPGGRVYGAASVLCQQRAEVRRCLRVGRGAFVPPPKVDSAVIQLQMRELTAPLPPLFRQLVRAAFGQRRKTLARALATRFPARAVQTALAATGVDGRLRAEMLDVATFVALAAALEASDGQC